MENDDMALTIGLVIGAVLGIIGGIMTGLSYHETTTYKPLESAKCLESTIHIQAADDRGLDVWTNTKVWCK